jgi:penicillin G amidase
MPITQAELDAALPDLTSTVQAPELDAPVDIFRDQWGVPHVRAKSEHDAFFAQGFVTAQDRLWHMDYDRRRALGRFAAVAGTTALQEDLLMRTFGLESAAKADFAVSSPSAQAMLLAYVAGVNAFINTSRSVPVEYRLLENHPELWEPWHCLAVYKLRNMLMGTYEMKLWRARLALGLGADAAAPLFRGYPDTGLVSVPPGELYGTIEQSSLDALAKAAAELNWLQEIDGGSNAWVISGKLSASGKPLVAGDSHRALDTPSVYYQIHLSCPQFRCSGFALPGVPGMPHFSHTEYAGWGMTHGFGDYQDLYIERFRSNGDTLEFACDDVWHQAEVSEQRIDVRGAETERLEVVRTDHGPIIAGNPRSGYGLAFAHTGTSAATPWINTVYELLHAKDADQVEEALREWTEPVNNFVYADVHGEFGYRYRGRIPIRAEANAWAPVPGWNSKHEWQGQIPFEDLPRARNPEVGYVVTCNNAPTTADYPYYLNTYFAADARARRITERLDQLSPGSGTVAEMASIHADSCSVNARVLQRRIANLESDDADVVFACAALRDWDCRMQRDSTAATIYATARTFIVAEAIRVALGPMANEGLAAASGIGRGAATHLGQLGARAIEAMAVDDVTVLASGQTWDDMLAAALRFAMSELRERLGDDTAAWSWGSLHQTRPTHPLSRVFPDAASWLNPPAVATHGDSDTPLAGGYALASPFACILMSVNRYIHDPSDWRNSRWIVPLGASGHPGSKHYADQVELWADVETIPQLWAWEDIEADAETQQILMP